MGDLQKVAVQMTYYTDIIEVPEDIAQSIKKYWRLFDKWIYDKNIDHGHWVFIDGKKMGVAFDTTAFVEYLNEYHLKGRDEKAAIVEKELDVTPKGIPAIWF